MSGFGCQDKVLRPLMSSITVQEPWRPKCGDAIKSMHLSGSYKEEFVVLPKNNCSIACLTRKSQSKIISSLIDPLAQPHSSNGPDVELWLY